MEISITCQEDAFKDKGTLILLSMIKKGEDDKNFVRSLVWGTGTVEDLIELSCKSSKFAMEQAVQQYHQLDGDFPPHQLQLQLSQIALQSLMNDKVGRIDIGIEKIIESCLDRLTIHALVDRDDEDERHDDE